MCTLLSVLISQPFGIQTLLLWRKDEARRLTLAEVDTTAFVCLFVLAFLDNNYQYISGIYSVSVSLHCRHVQTLHVNHGI